MDVNEKKHLHQQPAEITSTCASIWLVIFFFGQKKTGIKLTNVGAGAIFFCARLNSFEMNWIACNYEKCRDIKKNRYWIKMCSVCAANRKKNCLLIFIKLCIVVCVCEIAKICTYQKIFYWLEKEKLRAVVTYMFFSEMHSKLCVYTWLKYSNV